MSWKCEDEHHAKHYHGYQDSPVRGIRAKAKERDHPDGLVPEAEPGEGKRKKRNPSSQPHEHHQEPSAALITNPEQDVGGTSQAARKP